MPGSVDVLHGGAGIWLQNWVICGVNVGKYATMEHMGLNDRSNPTEIVENGS